MGEEIETAGFARDDFVRFADHLAEETEIARGLFVADGFSRSGHALGFEIECWILDHNYFPSAINQLLLETLAHPLVVPELSRFNVELNCDPLPFKGKVFDRAATVLSKLWAECNAVAHTLDANMVMIGTLPTIRDDDLTLAHMSPLNRFYALNREVLRQRRGRALRIDITGREQKAPADLVHLYYNASIAVCGPVLAACGNAPFLFGKCLWEETRIPLFEQAIDVPVASSASRRVTMGSGYLTASCFEVFEQNRREYPVLLPMSYNDPPAALRHLRLHNGTIWRWNRPLIGFDKDGGPHLRIEHRVLPAGPTICDMIANAEVSGYPRGAGSLATDRRLLGSGIELKTAQFSSATTASRISLMYWCATGLAFAVSGHQFVHIAPTRLEGLALPSPSSTPRSARPSRAFGISRSSKSTSAVIAPARGQTIVASRP
jgi:hypothetical protein